jgi:hypothetical protein
MTLIWYVPKQIGSANKCHGPKVDDENEGGLVYGVIPEMVWAIEKSRHLLKAEYKE